MSTTKLLSTHYLFETPIQTDCRAVGLVRPGNRGGTGRGAVSAHLFRYSSGPSLPNAARNSHAIMKVLEHTSVKMALVYAFDAIAWKFQTGSQWTHLAEKYGNWRGVYNRLRMWAIDGIWERVFTALVAQTDRRRRPRPGRLGGLHNRAPTPARSKGP
jgi:transposase